MKSFLKYKPTRTKKKHEMIVDKRSKKFGRKRADRQVIIKVLICSLSERIRSKIIKAQNPKDSGMRGWQEWVNCVCKK